MEYRTMSSVESDFARHPGDGPDGAFLVWLIPAFWPVLILILIVASILERRPSRQKPSGPKPKPSPERLPHDLHTSGGFEPYTPLPRII